MSGLVIELEGNIGSGKSILCEKLNYSPGISVMTEKMNEKFLQAFYDDPSQYGIALQLFTLATRRYERENAKRLASKGQTIILDRGIFGDIVFASMGKDAGTISETDYGIYKSVVSGYTEGGDVCKDVDVMVYLDVDPGECLSRLSSRGTKAEEGMMYEYMDKVDSTYFETLIPYMCGRSDKNGVLDGKCPPVVVMKWDKYGTSDSVMSGVSQALEDGGAKISMKNVTPHIETEEKLAIYLDEKPAGELFLKWDIPHTCNFRRSVMSCLARGYPVTLCTS